MTFAAIAQQRTVVLSIGLAATCMGLVGCSKSPSSPPSTPIAPGAKAIPNSGSAAEMAASEFDEDVAREQVRAHLALLLSRPDFRVLGWSAETVQPFELQGYWVMTGRIIILNVFQEQTTHEFGALFLPPEELLRLSVDGENIWQKPLENVSQPAQSTLSQEDYDRAVADFAARFSAEPRRTATTAGDDSFGRVWTDRTGRYAVRAQFGERTASGLIRLEKQDGTSLQIAESELSADDRAWIAAKEAPQPNSSD